MSDVCFSDWNDNSDTFEQSYGSSSALWGLSWTTSDINASNFGLAFAAQNDSASQFADAYVDNIRITVYYTAGAAAASNAPVFPLSGVPFALLAAAWVGRRAFCV
jgi:hypothetical protein